MCNGEKQFEIEWLDGTKETMHGYSISDAFMKAGYGGGAVAAIDSWREVKSTENVVQEQE